MDIQYIYIYISEGDIMSYLLLNFGNDSILLLYIFHDHLFVQSTENLNTNKITENQYPK